MGSHRSWDEVKRARPEPRAETRAVIEQELDDELAAEIERVRVHKDFIRRAGLLLERDEDLLNRLAE